MSEQPQPLIVAAAEDPQKTLKMPALKRTTRTLPVVEHNIGQGTSQPAPELVPLSVQEQNILSLPTISYSDENFFSFSETDVDIVDIISDKTYSFIRYKAVSIIPRAISMDNERPIPNTQDFSEIDIDSIDSLMLPEHTQQHEVQQQEPILDNEVQPTVSTTSLEPISETDIELPFIPFTPADDTEHIEEQPTAAISDEAQASDIRTQDEDLAPTTSSLLQEEEHTDEIEAPITTEHTQDEESLIEEDQQPEETPALDAPSSEHMPASTHEAQLEAAHTPTHDDDEKTEQDVETSAIAVITLEEQPSIAETPSPLQDEVGVEEQIVENVREAQEGQEEQADPIELPETPRIIDTSIPLTPLPESPPGQVTPALSTRQPIRTRQQRKRQPLWRRILFGGLLFLLIANVFLLWRDLTSTHLDLTTIDPRNGSTRTQQDIGSYQDAPSLTAPISDSSSVFVGVQSNNGQDTQQILTFTDSGATWHLATQFSAPLAHGALQINSDGHLFVQSMNALQVWSVDKQAHQQLLWQVQGPQPTRGVHPFQPASDGQNLYTIKSVASVQIASYDLHTGQQRWSQTLHDTLNYAPPFLVNSQTLYVASDANIYALKSSDGTLLWEKPYPTRTLLLARDGQTPSIISVGAKGLLALNPITGATIWSFTGQATNTLTSTQFYQATLANTDHATGTLIYATGIAWQIPQVREQLWFYAINARTGSLVWSKPVGSSFISADAGRILTPIVDTTDGIVVLQQQVDEQKQRMLAFDIVNGTLRWSKDIQNNNGSSLTLLRTPDDSLLLFSVVDETGSIFRTFSPWRFLIIQLITGSVVGLLLLWLLPLATIRARFTAQLQMLTQWNRRRGPIDRARRRRGHLQGAHRSDDESTPHDGRDQSGPYDNGMAWHISYRWLTFVLIVIVLGTGIVTYVRLNQPQDRILQVSARTGATQWQREATQGTQPLATNTQSSFVITQTANNTSQLESLNAQGQKNWQSFSSEGTFSMPVPSSHPGTLLVALSGHSPLHYQFAPSDPSYDHTLDSFLALYLLDQASGKTLWQSNAIYPDEQQNGVVLGADTHDVYIASTQAISSTGIQGSPTPTIQLFALNQDTGAVDWRIFGPAESAKSPHDDGKLLLRQGMAIWQVAGIVYAIDTGVGQIAWRQPLVSDSATFLVPEEQQMIFAPSAVLVTRLDGVYALDLTSGNEIWHVPGLGTNTAPSVAGIALVGHTLLLYGNSEVDAYNVSNQHNLWHHKELAAIQHLSISDDGKIAYILLLSSVLGSTPTPSVAALDIQTGTIHWTFTPAVQPRDLNAPLVHTHLTFSDFRGILVLKESRGTPRLFLPRLRGLKLDSFFYSHGTLFVTICSSYSQEMCADTHLYALDGTTGKTVWNMAGSTLSDLHISQDGSSLLFRLVSSPWNDMLTHLKG